ncbi:hypothetical protein HYS82_01360 [Candidatus Amesbacteria bacterium]|nr:hypothetical protein [Candidatus Amesbacteria bacterium]MBI2587601.1 hypothetical protein [Candidatus Amesbacteria bacterium]
MTNQDLVLNIAVNLGRVGRFLLEGKITRAQQFALEAKKELSQLTNCRFSLFKPRKLIDQMINEKWSNVNLADDCFTWAAILTHRAKLA